MKILVAGIISIFFITGLNAKKLYVVSPAAKLLNKPKMSSNGTPLKKGTQLKQIGKKGMFYKVKNGNKTGWISKIFVSTKSPLKSKVSFGDSIKRSTQQNARRRASSYSETASARGLSASQKVRTRGSKGDYDFESIKWLERQKVSDKELNKFVNQKE